MKFIDEAIIEVIAGNGGNGSASFRREKFIEFGGPNGGDGGKGGDVIFIADKSVNTLIEFNYIRKYVAKNGTNGSGSDCYGKKGDNIYLKVPIGTIVSNFNTKTIIVDFKYHNQMYTIAHGGKGGLGNLHFKSSINRAPRQFTYGELGESYKLLLELKILADVGVLGLPNAGKSTLISKITSARPKIANYPFTTLNPKLGVVMLGLDSIFTIADIPGLIPGASQGHGLGIKFLKHLQRTKILLHLIDISEVLNEISVEKIATDAVAIVNELKNYNLSLYNKTRYLVINKIDMLDQSTKEITIMNFINRFKEHDTNTDFSAIFTISAINGDGCNALCKNIMDIILNNRYIDICE